MHARKRQPQLSLDLVRDKNGQRRGGPRPGAGRKPKGPRAGSPHKPRPAVTARHPQHVVMRVTAAISWLRRPQAYRAIRAALATVAAHDQFRVVHISIQRNHVHLLCEATDKDKLARGVQGFQISAARHLNRAAARRGQVFVDRYHATSIESVRQARHALAYVLNNWRRHRQDRGGAGLFGGRLDPFASGPTFPGWREALPAIALPARYEALPVCRPQTWLLAEGWKRASPLSVFEVPGG